MRSRILVAAAIVVLASMALTGCKALDPPGTKASGASTSTAGAVSIQTPGGTVDLGGVAGKVPAGFPKDLPLYTKGVKAGSVVGVPGGSGFTVQMVTGDTVDATFRAYQTKLTQAGYKIVSKGAVDLNKADQAFVTFSKGKAKGLVSIKADTPANGGKTQILVQITVPKS